MAVMGVEASMKLILVNTIGNGAQRAAQRLDSQNSTGVTPRNKLGIIVGDSLKPFKRFPETSMLTGLKVDVWQRPLSSEPFQPRLGVAVAAVPSITELVLRFASPLHPNSSDLNPPSGWCDVVSTRTGVRRA